MLAFHEPARLVSAERQDREAETAMLFTGGLVVDTLVKAGVADMVDLAHRRRKDKGCPKRHAAVSGTARRPVMRGLCINRDALQNSDTLAPIHGTDACVRQSTADNRVVAERRDDVRRCVA
jgi:hypothetical protein